MLGKKFDILCTVCALASLAALFASLQFNENHVHNVSVGLFIFFAVIFVVFTNAFSSEESAGSVEGIDKDKGVDDDVTLFIKIRHHDRFEVLSDVVVTTLSADSKREIKNLLAKIEKLTGEKEGVIVKLIAPLLFALISVLLYLELSTDIPRGPLAISFAFVSTFSFFHYFIRMLLNLALASKNKAIGKVAIKNQRFRDDDGSTKTIKPFIFDGGYEEIKHTSNSNLILNSTRVALDFYSLLDNLRAAGKKSEVDKILKDFVLLENSDMDSVEKADATSKLMEKLDDLDNEALKKWCDCFWEELSLRKRIELRDYMTSSWKD